jgi:hypothetical protein
VKSQEYDLKRSQDHSKFSTEALETQWWRADIHQEDISWVRQHLGRAREAAKQFEVIPKTVSIIESPIGPDWPSRVRFVEGETAPRVQIPLGERYDYRAEYGRAKLNRDPHLSPHGLFRDLENGRHEHAMQFMQRFGPLIWKITTGRRGDEGWVNLSDFWDRHARFVAVAQLWESRFEPEALKQAWRWIHERLDQVNRVGPAPFGATPNWNFDQYYKFPGVFPWDRTGGIEKGLQWANPFLRMAAQEVVHYELNLQTRDCDQIWVMQPLQDGQDVTFDPIRRYRTLWGAIWDLFGQDIGSLKYGWRVCHECKRRFYPKDHRSVCCSTAHQALWSKRKWARDHRKSQVLSS